MNKYLNEFYSDIKDELNEEYIKITKDTMHYKIYILNCSFRELFKKLKNNIIMLRSK